MSLKNKKILVGLTGGIACYKVPYLVRFLVKAGAEVQVVMTDAAKKFITPLTLETVSQRPVASELFPEQKFIATRHIDLSEWPDLVVIAPATANMIGKIASGISDDLLSTILCASPRPVMIAPAMNPQMWLNKVTQRNVATLRELGYHFVEPGEGEMACDHVGVGRMEEPDKIFEAIKKFISDKPKKKSLTGKKVLITAGPTREEIDPVRYISNHSSGKMGYALAKSAHEMGAEVTLISGPTDLLPPQGIKILKITSTEQLHKAVLKEFVNNHILIMSAAPADFTPASKKRQKIKKHDSFNSIELKPTSDILLDIAKVKKKSQFVVGFALETENRLENAKKKLNDKKLDMIVVNSPTDKTGFHHDTNAATIIAPKRKKIELPLMSKADLADCILDYLAKMF